MEQSLPKKTLDILDPYPKPFRKELLNNTCCQNIQKRQFSSVIKGTPKNSLSDPSIRRRWSTNSLDDEIKSLLHEKLVRKVVKGRPSETLQFHRGQLVKELAEWIGVFDNCSDSSEDENVSFRDQLISLLATASKQKLKDIPLDNSEWIKLLNQWIKNNTSGAVISSREIYRILSVDGFQGFKPKHLKLYLSGVLLPLRVEYKSHVRGIRKMYEYFEKNEAISSLTGTDSACVVFIALLEWYVYKMKDDLMLDDQIEFQVQHVKGWAKGFLQQHAEYYRDVKNVDEEMLENFGKIYAEQFQDDDSWKVVGSELLKNLNCDDI